MPEDPASISLREHFDAQLKSQETLLRAEITALADLLNERKDGTAAQEVLKAEAIKTALASIIEHLKSMNEFRLVLTSQQETLVTKDQLRSEIKSLEQQLTQLVTLVTALASNVQVGEKADDKSHKYNAALIGWVFGGLGLLIGALGLARSFLE